MNVAPAAELLLTFAVSSSVLLGAVAVQPTLMLYTMAYSDG